MMTLMILEGMKEKDYGLNVRITVHGSYMPINNRIKVLRLTHA